MNESSRGTWYVLTYQPVEFAFVLTFFQRCRRSKQLLQIEENIVADVRFAVVSFDDGLSTDLLNKLR